MDAYSFFICLFIKERKVFNEILNRNFTVDNFCHFVDQKGFKYRFNELQSTKNDNNKNNYFIRNDSLFFNK